MYEPLKSPLTKIAIVIALVVGVTVIAAIIMWPDRAYTQILLGPSPSESESTEEIAACAEHAIDAAVEDGAVIDIALVSRAPAAMAWRTIDARQTLATRLTLGKSRDERQLDRQAALDAVDELMAMESPPGSSQHLSALSESVSRAHASARGATPAARATVLCSDGHWSSECGSAYDKAIDAPAVLRCLREAGLMSNWERAALYFDASTVDRVADVPAAKEAAIRRFWLEWARASNAKLSYR